MSLKIDHLTRTFNGTTAINDISFEVAPGEIVGLLGTSGCGKSTLLRAASGLDSDYEGTISVQGNTTKGVKDNTGFIFQEPRLLPWLTVLENVTFGLYGTKKDKREKGKRFLELVGLKGSETLYPRELSGGMAQRVAIARALVTDPEVFLLDEPFSALDAFTKMQLQDLLIDIWKAQRTTMLLVTHDVEEALYLCDRIIILKGKPGRFEHELIIEEARPRNRGSQSLANYKLEILNRLELTNTEAVQG